MSDELAEVITEEDGGEIAVLAPQNSVTLFGTDDPVAVLERATRVADALAGVIEKQKLYASISGKKHITVEGWTLLGSMLGVFPEIEWTRKTTDQKGADAWEARCVARTRDGSTVGAREAMCSRSENRWKGADDYAVRSMAQTRATSAALAAPLRFVVVLAGFAGTPEAEMPKESEVRKEPESKVPRSWDEVIARMKEQLGDDEAMEWLTGAKELKEMNAITDQPTLLQRLGGVVVDLEERPEDFQFAHAGRGIVRGIFGARLDGNALDGPEWCLDGADAAEVSRPAKNEVLARRSAE